MQRWFEHVQSRRMLNMEISGYSEGGHAEDTRERVRWRQIVFYGHL